MKSFSNLLWSSIMMRNNPITIFNIVTFGKKDLNLQTAIINKTIGSPHASFEAHIKKDNTILLHSNGQFKAAAKVSSQYFLNNEKLWSDKLYPHRFKIDEIIIFEKPIDLLEIGFNDEMREISGKGWAFTYIFAPKPLPIQAVEFLKNHLDW